jgi:hypothetical protein
MIPNCGEVKPTYEISYVCHLETHINVAFCKMSVIVIMDNGANFYPCYGHLHWSMILQNWHNCN